MMQHLNTLWRMLNAASTIRDFAQHRKVFYFPVVAPLTFYLQSESATVHVRRWRRPMIEAQVTLQGAFGWRIATDQDDAGVYIAAKRRPVVGELSSARFEVFVPHDTYLVIKLDDGALLIDNVAGTLHIPPAEAAKDSPLLLCHENV